MEILGLCPRSVEFTNSVVGSNHICLPEASDTLSSFRIPDVLNY
jgi:hypothetical protein